MVEIWPCNAGEAVEGAEANVSRSLRIAVDCLRAELKRGFCVEKVSWLDVEQGSVEVCDLPCWRFDCYMGDQSAQTRRG